MLCRTSRVPSAPLDDPRETGGGSRSKILFEWGRIGKLDGPNGPPSSQFRRAIGGCAWAICGSVGLPVAETRPARLAHTNEVRWGCVTQGRWSMSRRRRGDYLGGSTVLSSSGTGFTPLASRWDLSALGQSETEYFVRLDETAKRARIHKASCRHRLKAEEVGARRFLGRLGRGYSGWSGPYKGAEAVFRFVADDLTEFEVSDCTVCKPGLAKPRT